MSNTFSNYISTTATMDLSITSNIIFVAVTAALSAVFLAAVIGVIVRGKRKCVAFDVILRVFASVVLFASAVLYASSWLCRMSGNVFIDASIPALIIGDTMRELPAPQLFAALQTMLGSNLMLGVLLAALIALICDCTIANKKESEKAAAKVRKTQKSPEELKREAEIARIRRLADSAVKKSSTAANSNKDNKDDKPEKIKADETTSNGVHESEKSNGIATEDSAYEEPDFDWRVEQPKKQSTSFVGIKEQSDDGFDSFDSFDSFDGGDNIAAAEEEKEEYDFKVIENSLDESTDDGGEGEASITPDAEQFDAVGEPSEQNDAEDAEDTEEFFEQYGDSEDAREEQNINATHNDNTAEQTFGGDSERNEADDDSWADESIEPDRNIYIPEIRKIVRYKREEPKPVSLEKTEAKPAAKKSATAKSTTARSTAKKKVGDGADTAEPTTARKKSAGAARPQGSGSAARAKATTARKNENNKKSANGPKNANGTKSASVNKSSAANNENNKKLPVTRRYVIIDRTSAVNIFSEYLKSKDERDKDKLESSISTIILK